MDDLKRVLRALVEQGWRIEQSRGGHWKCYPPRGRYLVVVSGTPSDRRAVRNAVATLRRHGFIWPRR